MMGRLRDWLFTLLSRTNTPKPDDPLPRPTPGEIMAVRVLIPVESNRTPGEQICITMFRLGYQKRVDEERPVSPFVPPPDHFRAPYYIAQIHTQHSLPAVPAVSPLRNSRLTQMLHAFPVPAAPPVPPRPSFQTRQLTPLPLPEEDELEFFEDDDWLNDVTERRRAV